MSNNLFIVSTPYHLLTAFILSNTIYKKDINFLALTHPHGYDYWKKDNLLDFLSSTRAGYQKIFPLIHWMTSKEKNLSMRKQVRSVQQSILNPSIDEAFLSSDLDSQNQLLVAALGLTQFYRFEDGLYSYYNEDRKRPLTHEYFHKIKLNFIKLISGIHSSLYLNTSASGCSPAGIADFMYLPELLKRPSPQVHEITTEMIQTAMRILEINHIIKEELPKGKYSIYLSQPITEQGKFSFEDEKKCLSLTIKNLKKGEKLIYKPHPNDAPYKLDYVKKHYPDIIINESRAPVEIILYREPQIEKVISYQSTTLMLAKKFTQRDITCISLLNFYHKPIHPAYRKILEAAGVQFMNKTEDN